jgi:hypothetical protein
MNRMELRWEWPAVVLELDCRDCKNEMQDNKKVDAVKFNTIVAQTKAGRCWDGWNELTKDRIDEQRLERYQSSFGKMA